MHTRFTKILSIVTTGIFLTTPLLTHAATPEDSASNNQALVMRCRETNAKAYTASLDEAAKTFGFTMKNQWDNQVGYRIRAARASRQAAVRRTLAAYGARLDTGLNIFASAQHNGMQRDLDIVTNSFLKDTTNDQDALLQAWTEKTTSFQNIDTVFTRSENALRLYADAQARTTLSRVWRTTKQQAEAAYTQTREDARQIFVEDMTTCVNDISADTNIDDADKAADDQETSSKKDTPSSTSKAAVSSIHLSANYQVPLCGQAYTLFADLMSPPLSGTGRLRWTFSDGTSVDQDITFQNPPQFVVYPLDLTNARVRSLTWAQVQLLSPNSVTSNRVDLNLMSCTQNGMPAQDNSSASPSSMIITDVKASVIGDDTLSICGGTRINFKGAITSNIATGVKYRWERSDGVFSPIQMLSFLSAGSQTVSDAWDISGTNQGWERLHVLYPNDTLSAEASFNITQICKK